MAEILYFITNNNAKMKYTKEKIEEALVNSLSWADVCRFFNIKPNTGAQTHLTKQAKKLGIQTPPHFLGKAHNRGKVFQKKDAINYCINGKFESSHRLKTRLIRDGYKEAKCEQCGLKEWQGEEIVLELDHIDNNHLNNELSNLQILCPNCHALKTRKNRK